MIKNIIFVKQNRYIMKNPRTKKGTMQNIYKQDITSDIQKALVLISKGFFLSENNTALEHKEGGYFKISKRVTNYFNK